MKDSKTIYIALGSNKGDKFKNLQLAVDAIFEKIGTIISISKVYQSQAMGFEGDDFLNTCIAVNTKLTPKKVLKTLQDIEVKLGRTPKKSESYESREIDLDIIFFEDEILDESNLVIPHPEAHKRKFVLEPLKLIAAKTEHPVLEKTVD